MSGTVVGTLDLEARLGALGAEIAAIMRPLVAPLQEKLEWVTGDDEQVQETAWRWRAMSESLTQVAVDERIALDRLDGAWEGLAEDSFHEAVDEVVKDLEELTSRAADVADQLDRAAVAVRRVEQIVRDLIRELIEWAALSLAVSAAGAIITLGASVAAGAAAAAAKAGIVGAKIATQLGQLALELRRIQLVLGVYESWLKDLGFVKRRLVTTIQGHIIKELAPIDGDWKPPVTDLGHIWLDPEETLDQVHVPYR